MWNNVKADIRILINHSEYGFIDGEVPSADHMHTGRTGEGEIDFWLRLMSSAGASEWSSATSIAVDVTGLMRPNVIALPLAFALAGFDSLTALYSDPSAYTSGVGTTFSMGSVSSVAPVNGFEGVHNSALDEQDLLIIGGGYDDRLIGAVAESKRAAEHAVLVGLPSLQPHMYQESLLKLHRASEFINNYSRRNHLFAPANDPFMTADVIADYIGEQIDSGRANVYLSPIGPKTQALGFSWYYLCEAVGGPVSIIFPYSPRYSRDTSTGIGRTWIFDLELGCLDLSNYPALPA